MPAIHAQNEEAYIIFVVTDSRLKNDEDEVVEVDI